MSFGSKWRGKRKAVSASPRTLTARSDVKLACARDKAQFVFTSLHGEINIAAASQFPLACHRLPSHHPPPLPERTIYWHSMPLQKYLLTPYWLNAKAIFLVRLMSETQTNKAARFLMRTPALSFLPIMHTGLWTVGVPLMYLTLT